MTSREFSSWPELHTARQNARTLQGKYQDTALALDRAHQALERIATRHSDDGNGCCRYCVDDRGHDGTFVVNFPCPDYRDATGVTP